MSANDDATPASLTRRHLLVATGASVAASAAAPVMAGSMTYPRLKRGINLHNLLNWPDTKGKGDTLTYVWPPFQGPRFSMSDSELRRLTSAGFDFVRLTVDPSIFIATTTPDHEAVLEQHAKAVVDQLLDAGLNVIFDLHPVGVNPAYAPLKLVESEGSPTFQAYVRVVGRAAGLLRDYPANRVALELMNEPLLYAHSEVGKWQSMLETLHRAARAQSATLPLVLTGMSSSYRKALALLDLTPFRNSNVLYTFHFYEPYPFTHQGVPHTDPQFISGLAWPEQDANAREVLTRALAASASLEGDARAKADADSERLIADYIRQHYDAKKIATSFDEVAQWAQFNRIEPSRLLLGEFGCVDSAAGLPMQGRLAWLRDVVANAERNRIAWAYWAYKGNGGMSLLEDGHIDRPTLSALIPTA